MIEATFRRIDTHVPEVSLARAAEPFPTARGAQRPLGSQRFSIRQTIV
jgi:hypothetical protein